MYLKKIRQVVSKAIRFTLITSEGKFLREIEHITQPIITARSEGKEKGRTLLIDFMLCKERDCNLPYIPSIQGLYDRKRRAFYLHRNDTIVHSEKPTHNSTRSPFRLSLNEVKSFSVGEHICRVIFE